MPRRGVWIHACGFQDTVTKIDLFQKVFAYLTNFKNCRALDSHTHIPSHKQHPAAILNIRLNDYEMTNPRPNN